MLVRYIRDGELFVDNAAAAYCDEDYQRPSHTSTLREGSATAKLL
jgi:hypothetical protein